MKIICWNINGIRACWKKGLKAYIQSESPDVVCLQEIKAFKNQCEEIAAELSDYGQVWQPAKRPGYSGTMTLYRLNFQPRVSFLGMPVYDDEGRGIATQFDDYTLINMYFPNGGSGDERHRFKMQYLKDILAYFKRLDQKMPLILTGDFNIAHREIDIHDPVGLDGESGFKPEERLWMDEFLSAGFVDVFRHFYPEAEEQYSWWSYRQASRQRNKGWRIDYFFVSERLKSRLQSMRMDQKVTGSDHCPLVLEIE